MSSRPGHAWLRGASDPEALMPNLLQFNPYQFLGFVIIFARVSGVMITAPVLNDANIPPQIKVAITLLLALVFYPVAGRPALPANPNIVQLVVLILGEVGVGVLIGFTAQLLFSGIAMAGEVIGFQMGLGIANVFDPVTQTQVSQISQLQTVMALMLFVGLDGHHIFINALAQSYAVVPAGSASVTSAGIKHFVGVGGQMFVLGVQLGAPLIVALLAANFSIGLVARAVPQVNIFVVGFPFTIALGMVLMMLAMPFFLEGVAVMHKGLEETLRAGLQALK
jgi:flagellar biosynthetic protein FliR